MLSMRVFCSLLLRMKCCQKFCLRKVSVLSVGCRFLSSNLSAGSCQIFTKLMFWVAVSFLNCHRRDLQLGDSEGFKGPNPSFTPSLSVMSISSGVRGRFSARSEAMPRRCSSNPTTVSHGESRCAGQLWSVCVRADTWHSSGSFFQWRDAACGPTRRHYPSSYQP